MNFDTCVILTRIKARLPFTNYSTSSKVPHNLLKLTPPVKSPDRVDKLKKCIQDGGRPHVSVSKYLKIQVGYENAVKVLDKSFEKFFQMNETKILNANAV